MSYLDDAKSENHSRDYGSRRMLVMIILINYGDSLKLSNLESDIP